MTRTITAAEADPLVAETISLAEGIQAAAVIVGSILLAILLQIRRPFRVGEQISSDEYERVVHDVDLRTTSTCARRCCAPTTAWWCTCPTPRCSGTRSSTSRGRRRAGRR